MAYPSIVVLFMLVLLVFLSTFVLPEFENLFADFGVTIPQVTVGIMQVGKAVPYICTVAGALVVLGALAAPVIANNPAGRGLLERLILSVPLVGAAVSRNLIARWCDALHLSVDAGLDLPQALEMVGQGIGSPALQRDTLALKDLLERGGRLDELGVQTILPAALPAAMQFAAGQQALASTLRSLGQMYQEEAKWHISALNAWACHAPIGM